MAFYYIMPTTMSAPVASPTPTRGPFPGGGFPGGGFPGGGFPGGGFPGGGFPGGGFPGGGFPGGGFPGGGFPGGPTPGGPTPGGPGGGGAAGAPKTAPPAFTPSKTQATKFTAAGPGGTAYLVSPVSIQPCLFRFTYLWLNNGASFWFWPVFLDATTISGFRWTGFNWAYLGVGLNAIDSFYCQ